MLIFVGLDIQAIIRYPYTLSESQKTDNLWGNFATENTVP